MGKKGVPHGNWSKEETLRIVKRHLDEHVSIKQLETEENINHSLVSAWVKRYREAGEDGLIAKKGNPYAALHTSKTLSELERLRLVVAKQEVEIERLKKGYWREWCKQGVRYRGRCDFEIIEALKEKYAVKYLCAIMAVKRSGYYKWVSRQGKPNRYEQDRNALMQLLEQEHSQHKSYGYHRLAHCVRRKTGRVFSDNRQRENGDTASLVVSIWSMPIWSVDNGTHPDLWSWLCPI